MEQLSFDELALQYGPWRVTHKYDNDCRILADRHYSRRTIGAKGFTRPGYNLVLKTEDGKAVWVTWRSKHRDDSFGDAWECTLFRNESEHQSSALIKWALHASVKEWSNSFGIPKNGMITYVDDDKIDSNVPGYCYIRSGFKAVGRSKARNLLTLQIPLDFTDLILEELNEVKKLDFVNGQMEDYAEEYTSLDLNMESIEDYIYDIEFNLESLREEADICRGRITELKALMSRRKIKAWHSISSYSLKPESVCDLEWIEQYGYFNPLGY